MNKIRKPLLVFLVSVFLLATTVTAAGASSEVQFLGSHFMVGKGLALFFKVSVDYDLSQLASVNVNGMQYELDCKVKDSGQYFNEVVCIAPLTRTSIGGDASIAFGPYAFSATIKDPRDRCYGIFDYGPALPWAQIGTHCQVRAAVDGNSILFWSLFGSYDTYVFGDPYCATPVPDFGAGFYYIGC